MKSQFFSCFGCLSSILCLVAVPISAMLQNLSATALKLVSLLMNILSNLKFVQRVPASTKFAIAMQDFSVSCWNYLFQICIEFN